MAKKKTPWAKKLKELRAKYGLTQEQAADKAGVATRTWISWENSQRKPSGPALKLLRLTFPDDFSS